MPSRRAPSSESVLNRAPLAYKLLDHITGVLLAFVVVFTPWAFGATVPWAIWTTCGVSYAMGALLVAKWIYRSRGNFQVTTWADPMANSWPMRFLAFLSGSFLLYVLIGAVNYRATGTYVDGELELDYRDAISWLPHSFNAPKSWRAFWRYLALVCLFWSARDWLLGKSRRERRPVEDFEDVLVPLLPSRLRRFLWVFCISSALLSLMGLLQRYDGSNKLLWILEARESNPNDFSFGPYSYRANAAQYFNLAWPVCLGFWWTLRKDSRRIRDRTVRAGSQSHVMLIPCLVFIATGPIASTSRGGALIFFATTAAALLVMLWSLRSKPMAWLGIVGFFAASLTIAVVVGGDKLMERFETVFQDKMSGRNVLYEVGHKMAADYPLFGTGAETFVSMYPLYRTDPTAQREGYAHDDWLETRITLGWVGLGILLAALLTIPWNWFSGRGVPGSLEFVLLLAVALGGLLAHAKFDFPFQIFSLVTVFLLLACVGTCVRRESV